MFNKSLQLLFALIFTFAFSSSVPAQENKLPQNYMMEKHGISEPFYCDLEDPIEEIACMAWDAALGSMNIYAKIDQFDREQFNLLIALSTMNLIQQEVSGLRSMLYYEKGFGGYTQDICLVQKRGSCGNHQFIFQKVMGFAGIENRTVGIYMELGGKRLSHAMNEIRIDDNWALFDTTNAAIYLSNESGLYLLSLEDLNRLQEAGRFNSRQHNLVDVYAFSMNEEFSVFNEEAQTAARFEQFAYLLDRTNVSALLYNGVGDVVVDLLKDRVFEQLPNYVGTNTGKNTGISMNLTVPNHDENLQLNLQVAGVGGCSSHGPIVLDNTGNEYPLTKGNNQIMITNGATFNVKREPEEICYIVFDDISVLH